MKILKKLIKKENGSITMTVLAAMLFITTVLVVSYFSISNQGSNQNRKIQQISKQYSVSDSQLEEKYNEKLQELNSKTYMDISEIRELGNIILFKQTNTETTDVDGNTVLIPAGYKIKEEENVDRVETGFVIADKAENEWVWIPVNSMDLEKMYVSDLTGWTMDGTDVNTKYKTLGVTFGNSTYNRVSPGENNVNIFSYWREPDIITEKDTLETYYTDADFESTTDMAKKMRDDYKDMIDSIRNNKGFYVGRFELGRVDDEIVYARVTKNSALYGYRNWYQLYKACTQFSGDSVRSRMIWGCQWDQVCRFISEHGNMVDINDSRTYGNYSNSIDNAAIDSGIIKKTGSSEYWKVNNIYDFAGNAWEWTQEAYKNNTRSLRRRVF